MLPEGVQVRCLPVNPPEASPRLAAPTMTESQGARSALVSGPLPGVLVSATTPLALALVVMFGVQLAEAGLVARLGSDALAALGFALPVVMTAMSFGIGLGAGASAVVGRALGGGEAGVPRLCAHVLRLAALLGVVVGAPFFLAAPWLIDLLGAEGEVRGAAVAFLRIWLLGLVPLLVGMAALSLLRAAGDTRFQGAALAGAGLLAFALDWPLMFGIPGVVPGLGLTGMAVAAGLSWTAMLAAGIWRLRRVGLLAPGAAPAGIGMGEATRRLLRIAVPAAATNAIIPFATGIFTAMVAAHGPQAVAGFALGSRVEALAMTCFFALSALANPFAAQNAGAGRPDRVREGLRAMLLFCGGFGLLLALPLSLGATPLAEWLAGDPAAARSAALYLALLPWGFGAIGAISVVNAVFNGLERPMAAVAVSLGRTLVVGVPAAWLGGQLAGEVGTLAGILLGNLAVAGLAVAWALRLARTEAAGLAPRAAVPA
jgi:putative MATE family efflux protein